MKLILKLIHMKSKNIADYLQFSYWTRYPEEENLRKKIKIIKKIKPKET